MPAMRCANNMGADAKSGCRMYLNFDFVWRVALALENYSTHDYCIVLVPFRCAWLCLVGREEYESSGRSVVSLLRVRRLCGCGGKDQGLCK